MAGTATPVSRSSSAIRSHDLRDLGLATATRQLNANVADLDIVFVARARSDVLKCPFCPVLHPVES